MHWSQTLDSFQVVGFFVKIPPLALMNNCNPLGKGDDSCSSFSVSFISAISARTLAIWN